MADFDLEVLRVFNVFVKFAAVVVASVAAIIVASIYFGG